MEDNRVNPKHQFSKRLARWTAVFWFAYMIWLSVILILEPSAALFSVYMGIMVTLVMIFMVVSYTRNSISEKMALAMLDKTKLELSFKSMAKSTLSNLGKSIGSEIDEDSEDDEEDGDSG